MIAIIDYGSGNLRSVQKALENVGAKAQITQNKEDLKNAAKLVLPGVGAIGPAMQKLTELDLIDSILEAVKTGKPFLGICLGYQLLFEQSDEGGNVKGLGILKGDVKKFPSLKIPQIGWNQLNIQNGSCPLFKNTENLSNAYFCHSYYVNPTDQDVIATTTNYGIDYASSVCKDNVYGLQFHPEKSQGVGLNILKNFEGLKA